jgi:hypothetical protein
MISRRLFYTILAISLCGLLMATIVPGSLKPAPGVYGFRLPQQGRRVHALCRSSHQPKDARGLLPHCTGMGDTRRASRARLIATALPSPSELAG